MTNSLKEPKRLARKKALALSQKTLLKSVLSRLSKSDLSTLNTCFSTLETSIAQTKGYLAVLKANFQALEQSPLMPLSTVRTKIRLNLVTLSEALNLTWEAEQSLDIWQQLLNHLAGETELLSKGKLKDAPIGKSQKTSELPRVEFVNSEAIDP